MSEVQRVFWANWWQLEKGILPKIFGAGLPVTTWAMQYFYKPDVRVSAPMQRVFVFNSECRQLVSYM